MEGENNIENLIYIYSINITCPPPNINESCIGIKRKHYNDDWQGYWIK